MKNTITLITTVLILFSCTEKNKTQSDNHNNSTEDTHNHDSEDAHNHPSEVSLHEEGLHLTMEQMETINLEFGDFSEIKVNEFIKSTGVLGLPPNAYSSVSPKASGIIKGNKKFIEGNYIKKGAIIGYIENSDFIILQEKYLEAKAVLTLKKQNLERQKSLISSNASSLKSLETAQSEFDIANAKTNSLNKQLSYLGISTNNLTASSISQNIPVYSPMSGFITSINIHNGMYAESTISLMEIISDKHLHLELDIFEKDIALVKKGQKISYSIPALGDKIYQGEVSIIGKEFDTKSKTVRVHGHLEGENPPFLKDLFINAKIWLNDNTSSALPEKAIIKDGASSLIFVGIENPKAKEISFTKIRVVAGATNNGFTAVKLLDEIPKGMKIVTNGAFYVYAQSMAGELEHDH